MFNRTTKTLLRNHIIHADTHNRIVEESEMWDQHKRQKNDSRRERSRDGLGEIRRRGDRHHVRSDRRNWEEDDDGSSRRGPRSTCYAVPRAHMDREQPTQSYLGREKDENFSKGTYWTKVLQKVEEADPNRWGHGGYKELYPNDFASSKSSGSSREASPAVVKGKYPRRLGLSEWEKSKIWTALKKDPGAESRQASRVRRALKRDSSASDDSRPTKGHRRKDKSTKKERKRKENSKRRKKKHKHKSKDAERRSRKERRRRSPESDDSDKDDHPSRRQQHHSEVSDLEDGELPESRHTGHGRHQGSRRKDSARQSSSHVHITAGKNSVSTGEKNGRQRHKSKNGIKHSAVHSKVARYSPSTDSSSDSDHEATHKKSRTVVKRERRSSSRHSHKSSPSPHRPSNRKRSNNTRHRSRSSSESSTSGSESSLSSAPKRKKRRRKYSSSGSSSV